MLTRWPNALAAATKRKRSRYTTDSQSHGERTLPCRSTFPLVCGASMHDTRAALYPLLGVDVSVISHTCFNIDPSTFVHPHIRPFLYRGVPPHGTPHVLGPGTHDAPTYPEVFLPSMMTTFLELYTYVSCSMWGLSVPSSCLFTKCISHPNPLDTNSQSTVVRRHAPDCKLHTPSTTV